MRDDFLWKVQGHERHIFMAIQMFLPCRNNSLGVGFDEVIHDRQVVGGEIPQNVDVVLEQP